MKAETDYRSERAEALFEKAAEPGAPNRGGGGVRPRFSLPFPFKTTSKQHSEEKRCGF